MINFDKKRVFGWFIFASFALCFKFIALLEANSGWYGASYTVYLAYILIFTFVAVIFSDDSYWKQAIVLLFTAGLNFLVFTFFSPFYILTYYIEPITGLLLVFFVVIIVSRKCSWVISLKSILVLLPIFFLSPNAFHLSEVFISKSYQDIYAKWRNVSGVDLLIPKQMEFSEFELTDSSLWIKLNLRNQTGKDYPIIWGDKFWLNIYLEFSSNTNRAEWRSIDYSLPIYLERVQKEENLISAEYYISSPLCDTVNNFPGSFRLTYNFPDYISKQNYYVDLPQSLNDSIANKCSTRVNN